MTNIKEAISAARAGARGTPVSDSRILCRVMDRWKMFCDARDISQTPYLLDDGLVEPQLLEHIHDRVKPGMTCVDVGACYGFHALLMAELVGPSGLVFAFEPHPRLFPMLKQNIEINNLCPRIRPFPNALGDAPVTGSISLHKRRYGGATLSERAKASFGTQESVTVQIDRLDQMIKPERGEPDFYIIQTNGFEPAVWAGMAALLKSKRKIQMIMEFIPRWYTDAPKFAADILDQGFNVSRIEGGHLLPLVEPSQFTTKFRSDLILSR